MSFYKNPEEMFKSRADKYKKEGDSHWAKAKNGEGDWHYGKAKEKYKESEINIQKSKESHGKTWRKG